MLYTLDYCSNFFRTTGVTLSAFNYYALHLDCWLMNLISTSALKGNLFPIHKCNLYGNLFSIQNALCMTRTITQSRFIQLKSFN